MRRQPCWFVPLALTLAAVLAGCAVEGPDAPQPSQIQETDASSAGMRDECEGVASDVIALSVLTSTIAWADNIEALEQTEEMLEDMQRNAPEELRYVYIRMRSTIADFASSLASRTPTLSPTPTRSPTPATTTAAPSPTRSGFDSEGFETHVERLRGWIEVNCTF